MKKIFLILFASILTLPAARAGTVEVTIMAANITSGGQKYGPEGIRCFQGLKPDIVLIQEFKYDSGLRNLVDTAFGPEFYYYCEPTGSIPNGIVSRYPILSSGYWNDVEVSDRNFAWAVIDIPGEIDLQCVSVHLKTDSSSIQDRQANAIKNYVAANFDPEQYIVVGGDINASGEEVAPIVTFNTFLNASNRRPRDDDGNKNTSNKRNYPYDWVMPNEALDARNRAVDLPSHSYSNGIVFDSRIYLPLSDVSPVRENDCDTFQHMPVMKCFGFSVTTPTPAPSPSPQPTIAPPYLLDQGFDGFQAGARPAGWAFTGCNADSDTYLLKGFYGRSAPALKLDADGDRIETPVFSAPHRLTFWYRGVEADMGDVLAVEEFYGASWNLLETFYYLPEGGGQAGPLELNPSSSQLRFTFSQYAGALAFDDVMLNTLLSTPTRTPSPVPTASAPPTRTPTPSPVPTASAPPSATPTPTPVPTASPTPSPRSFAAVVGDYDGDGTSDIALFRPSAGLWLVRHLTRAWFGAATDQPVPQDYNGNRSWDLAIYRPSLGKWMVRGLTGAFYGVSTDLPVPADYNGDGSADIAVFRPTIGKWLVRGGAQVYYGFAADTVVPGDYDGDSTTDVAVFRPSLGKWLVKDGPSGFYGVSTDTTVPGDYTGDGSFDFAVFRPSTGRWLVKNGPNAYWGTSSDTVQPGDYDGDGTLDFAVWRSSVGRWLVKGVTAAYYGASTDQPVTNP